MSPACAPAFLVLCGTSGYVEAQAERKHTAADELVAATGSTDTNVIRQRVETLDVRWRNPENGWTALHYAAGAGKPEVCAQLIAKGAAVDVATP